jgi:hypothetical protein
MTFPRRIGDVGQFNKCTLTVDQVCTRNSLAGLVGYQPCDHIELNAFRLDQSRMQEEVKAYLGRRFC